MRVTRYLAFLLVVLTAGSLLFPSCKTMDKTRRGAVLGAAAGGAIGALIGKKAGNSAIGATIGAALGGSTGAFIASKLDKTPDSLRRKMQPLYVLNGTLVKEKQVQNKLSKVTAEEITSVKVLTNNEATALYGTKGENGAILISFKESK